MCCSHHNEAVYSFIFYTHYIYPTLFCEVICWRRADQGATQVVVCTGVMTVPRPLIIRDNSGGGHVWGWESGCVSCVSYTYLCTFLTSPIPPTLHFTFLPAWLPRPGRPWLHLHPFVTRQPKFSSTLTKLHKNGG